MSQSIKDAGLKFAIYTKAAIDGLCLTPDFAVSVWIPILSGLAG